MAAVQAMGARDVRASCRICGQPALPAVRLCAQCKAALKRVRHDTVSQQMPMPRRARGGDRSHASAPTIDAAASEAPRRGGPVAWRGMRIPLVLGATVAIVGSAGYFIVRQIHAATPPEAVAAAQDGDAARAQDQIPSPTLAIQTASAPVAAPEVANPGASGRDVAPPAVAKTKSLARSAKASPLAVGPPEPDVRPEPAPPPVVVAVAPSPVQRPPDRMQLLAQAFAQCPQDSVVPRMLCEQKARLQFCDGYWGQNPQCPDGAPPSYYSR